MRCTVYQLGQIDYSKAYALQIELLKQRVNNVAGDALLLLEHPPTITIGKSGKLENILVSRAELSVRGIATLFIDRGGDVTYHGPGQLVGYPIIDLRHRGRDLHRYVYGLEEVLIRTLNDFGIRAGRDRSHRGVWVAGQEIAAIGLRVKKWVTMHGFALNINTDLEPFSLINPCGFSDRGATSMAAVLSQGVPTTAVTEKLLLRFSEIFDAQLELASSKNTEGMLAEIGGGLLAGIDSHESKTTVLV